MIAEISFSLDAFYLGHRRCGELESAVEDDRVWMTCLCGAVIVLLPYVRLALRDARR